LNSRREQDCERACAGAGFRPNEAEAGTVPPTRPNQSNPGQGFPIVTHHALTCSNLKNRRLRLPSVFGHDLV
jgi:hypothetical protein